MALADRSAFEHLRLLEVFEQYLKPTNRQADLYKLVRNIGGDLSPDVEVADYPKEVDEVTFWSDVHKRMYSLHYWPTDVHGPPGHVHGGCIAAIFDDVCGWYVTGRLTAVHAVTKSLHTFYYQSIPLDTCTLAVTGYYGPDPAEAYARAPKDCEGRLDRRMVAVSAIVSLPDDRTVDLSAVPFLQSPTGWGSCYKPGVQLDSQVPVEDIAQLFVKSLQGDALLKDCVVYACAVTIFVRGRDLPLVEAKL